MPSAAPTLYELAGKSGAKTLKMHAVGKIEIRGEHGAVKGWKANLVEQMELDAGEVAVSKERLGMRGDCCEVEAVEQVV